MAVVKFSKQTIEPNPLEVDYWVDITSDPYGSVWKYYNGIDWVSLNLNDGSDDGLSSFDYYTKEQVNSLLSGKADVDSVESKVDDAEFANVIQNIEFREIGDNQMEMVLLKYDNATVGVTIPMASETNPGMLSGESFRDFVKQSQLQSLYDELYQIMSDLSLAEKERNDAELLRKTNEDARISAETNRFNAENTRQSEEANRVTNENNRVTAENNRTTAEQLREQAEENRASTFNTLEGEMQTTIQEGKDANELSEAATQRANDAAHIIEEWDSTVATIDEEGDVNDPESDIVNEAIRKTPQTLSKAEQTQARVNIGAASLEENEAFKTEVEEQVVSIEAKVSDIGSEVSELEVELKGGDLKIYPQPTKIIENARIRIEGHLLFDSHAQGCNVACYELEDNVEISYTIKNNPLSENNAAVASYLTKEQCEYDQTDSVKNKAEHVYSLCANGKDITQEGVSTVGFSKYIRVSYNASEGLPLLFYTKQVDGVNKKLEELGRKVDGLNVDKLNEEVFGSSEPVDVYPEPSLIAENKRLYGAVSGGGYPIDDNSAQGYNIACYVLKQNMPISFKIEENSLSSNNVAVAAYATKEICEDLSNNNRKSPSKIYALCNGGTVISGSNVDTTDNPIYIRVSYNASEGLPILYYTDTEGKKGLVDKVNDLESALPDMGKDVYMYNIPNELYVLKGVRQKIYYNQMIVGGESTHDNTITNIRCYVKFASGLTMSSADDEGFSILSYTEGDYSVEFSAYDLNMVEIVKKNILIHIVSANTSRKNILMTGASWVDINNGNKGYTAFLNMWSSSIGAELNFCGTKDAGTSGLKHEGHGGTTYNWFATNASSPFISEGSINVTKYRTEILGMNETFDAVYIQLGGNEATSNTNIVDESSFVKELWNYAEMIYDAILSDSPNCKIFAYIPALCSTGVTGFASLNKGTTNGVVGKIRRTYLIQKYLRYYIENTEKYKGKVFPCQDALGLSRWMGFGYKDMRYRYFKIGSSISSSDLQKIRQHDWSANYYMKAEGYPYEFLICGYDVRGYVLGLERQGTNWHNENQEFVNDWSEKSNDVPNKGTLVLSGGSIGKDFPSIPFDECVIENSEVKKHVFDNGTHPCETGYRQLALALCNQVLSV